MAYKALYPNETQDADYLIQDVVWEHYAADARLTYRLKADLMLHYRDRRLSLLEQPDMQWFMPYQDWLAESREGTFFHDRQVLNLHQKVQMRRQSDSLSDDYFSDPRSLVFKTDNLDLFLQEDRGYTEAEVKVFTDWWPKSVSHKNIQNNNQGHDSNINIHNDDSRNMLRVTAQGMQVFMVSGTIDFLHQVKSTWSATTKQDSD